MKPHEILKKLRTEAGYTQQNVADLLKIDRSAYTYYESGKTSPSADKLVILSTLYGISVDELLGKEVRKISKTITFANVSSFNDEAEETKTEKFRNLSRDEQQLIMSYRAFGNKKKFLELVEKHLIENEMRD